MRSPTIPYHPSPITSQSGSGTIHSEKGDFQINQGDSYHFEIKEKYFIEGDNLLLGITNAPKWTFEQYREVD